jgi:predicted nucleotidyltransferase
MGQRQIKQIARKLVQALARQRIRAEKVVLFGSYARANYHKDSDLDIMIISRDFAGRDLLARSRILANAHWAVPDYPMDIVAATPQEWKKNNSLIINYARTGKVIY